MSKEDQPPQHMWLNDEALSDHFQRVRERWSNPGGSDPEESSEPMNQNELTRGLRRG